MRTTNQRGSTQPWAAGLGLLGLLICVALGMWMYAQIGEATIGNSKSSKEQSKKALEQVEQIKRQIEQTLLERNKAMGLEPPESTGPATQPAKAPAAAPAKTPVPATGPATGPARPALAPTPPPPGPKGMVNDLQKQIDQRNKELEP